MNSLIAVFFLNIIEEKNKIHLGELISLPYRMLLS